MSRPVKSGCMEVYNDYNFNLTNLFHCVKERPMALLLELGFLPLNSRDEFESLQRYFECDEFNDEYLTEELALAEKYLLPLHADAIRKLLLKRAPRGNIRRAANYYKLIRYSFSGAGKSFGGKPCNIRSFFHQIWQCSRRLENVVIENKDFDALIEQYDRENAFIYCDPPYYEAECYEVAFPKHDHYRLQKAVKKCSGYVMVSYNYCPFILELYKDFYIFRTTRPNSMLQTAGSEYEEAIITNYDPRANSTQMSMFGAFGNEETASFQLINEPKLPLDSNGKIIFNQEELNEV